MKKVLLSVAVVAALGLASCGGPSVCDCVEMGEEMAEKMKEAGGDADKLKEIEEEYKDDIEACDELGKDASDEEKEEMAKEMEECGK